MYILKIEPARFQDEGSVNQTQTVCHRFSASDGEFPPYFAPLGGKFIPSFFTSPPFPKGLFVLFCWWAHPVVLFGGCKRLWEIETAVLALLSIKLVVRPHPPSNEK